MNEITRTRIASTNTDFTYDGVPGASNGNLTNDGVRTYEWDALNRLVKVYKTPSSPSLIGEYTYDALGRRIRKVVTNGGLSGSIPNGTTDYLYNTQWQCVEERNSGNSMARQYVWGVYIDDLIQVDIENQQGPSVESGVHYPLQDLLYRTQALVSNEGVTVEVYDYDAYGNTLIFNAPGTGGNWWASDASQSPYANCEALFTGQRYDAESGIYVYRHRMYAPGLGRFLLKDPILFSGGSIGLYAYVLNAPTLLLDPSGLRYWVCVSSSSTEMSPEWVRENFPSVRPLGENDHFDSCYFQCYCRDGRSRTEINFYVTEGPDYIWLANRRCETHVEDEELLNRGYISCIFDGGGGDENGPTPRRELELRQRIRLPIGRTVMPTGPVQSPSISLRLSCDPEPRERPEQPVGAPGIVITSIALSELAKAFAKPTPRPTLGIRPLTIPAASRILNGLFPPIPLPEWWRAPLINTDPHRPGFNQIQA